MHFAVNDELIEVERPAGMPLLDFLRQEARLTGVKHACREGDCGSCVVMVGTPEAKSTRYEIVTSCLVPLGSMDGRHIVTVEGLRGPGLGRLQRAFAAQGASQCGFCTPGFIVSLTSHLLEASTWDIEPAVEAVAGNICRCTGYSSIVRAMQDVLEHLQKAVHLDEPRVAALVREEVLPEYFGRIDEILTGIESKTGAGTPTPSQTIISGGTDLFVQRPVEISTADVFILRRQKTDPIRQDGEQIYLAGTATAEDLKRSQLLAAAVGGVDRAMELMGSLPIRNRATIAGNLVNASPIGDMTIMLLALDAEIGLKLHSEERTLKLGDFFLGYKKLDIRPGEIIEWVRFPLPGAPAHFNFEKVSKRTHLDIASVNSAMLLVMEDGRIARAWVSAGGVGPDPHAAQTDVLLPRGVRARRRNRYRSFGNCSVRSDADFGRPRFGGLQEVAASTAHSRPLQCPLRPRGRVSPGARRMSNHEIGPHVRGESLFIGDLPDPPGLLHAAVLASPVAHGHVLRLDTTPAAGLEGIHCILTAADIPGENQIGGIVQDEPLLAEGEVHFIGQPVAVVVAETPQQARAGAAQIALEINEIPGVFDPRAAAAAGDLMVPSRTLSLGDVDAAWKTCHTVVQGRADSAGQEHLYLETQTALVIPQEGDRLRILSSTQAPTAVQRITARVLGLPMNAIEVDVTRLGGAFGGKEDQATPWAVIAALAARALGRPIRMELSRHEDMVMTGKRHPYSSDFKIGLAADGTILAYEATYYQNAGAAADLSPAILERSLLHSNSSYFVPNVRVTALSCRTNLPPFTAFRGFGAPQAMFVMEVPFQPPLKRSASTGR